MNMSFYNAYTALKAYQSNLNVISNNIANINTVGFKTDTTSFDDLIYTEMNVHLNSEELLHGHGVKVGNVGKTFNQSSFTMTNQPLDFAIADENYFFGLEKADGTRAYSKAGNFALSVEDEGVFLVSSNGYYVLNDEGEHILLEEKEDGSLDTGTLNNVIGLFKFDNKYELNKDGSTAYLETEKSGVATAMGEDGNRRILIQGSIEDSSVDLSDEMANMITAQRAFQVNSKILQAANEIEDIVNHLRG